jgi:hypothetical protein
MARRALSRDARLVKKLAALGYAVDLKDAA